MKKELVAKISVPRTDGNTRTGTAYPIGSDLLLTAKHIIDFPERDLDANCQILWPDLGCDLSIKVCDLKYQVFGDHDISILRCTLPQSIVDLVGPSVLSGREHSPRSGWESLGYPKINSFERDEATGSFGVAGGNFIKLTLDDTIDTENSGQVENGWGGMSGAPVFCLESNKIQAIIITHDQWMQKTLIAISIPWMLSESSSFRQHTGFDQSLLVQQKIFNERCLKFVKKIENSSLFAGAIAPGLMCDIALQATPQSIIDLLNKELIAAPIDLLEKLRLIIEPEVKRNSDAVEDARHFFCLVLGMYAAGRFSPEPGGLHQLSVRTRATVEINLAAHYQLPPDLERKIGDDVDIHNSVAGRYAIEGECIPEVGWDKNANAETIAKVVNVVANKAYEKVYSVEPSSVLDEFAREELNATLLTRRKGENPQLIRFEISAFGKNGDDHPLLNDKVCATLQGLGYLPDLPVVRYGLGTAEDEAKLRAQINEFFRVIEESTP